MTFQCEKQSFFTKELTKNCPLLTAFGGSSGESFFRGVPPPNPLIFTLKSHDPKLNSIPEYLKHLPDILHLEPFDETNDCPKQYTGADNDLVQQCNISIQLVDFQFFVFG